MAKKRRQKQMRGDKKVTVSNRGLTHANKPQAKPRLPKDASRARTAAADRITNTAQSVNKPSLPFDSQQFSKPSLLLIGEGDFSHAASLLRTYYTGRADGMRVTATAYDGRDELLEKYPQAESLMSELRARGCEVSCGIDAGALKKTLGVWRKAGTVESARERDRQVEEEDGEEWEGFADEVESEEAEDGVNRTHVQRDIGNNGISGTAIDSKAIASSAEQGVDSMGGRANPMRRQRRVYDRIIFNFPHVGGKASGHSTDVNRQVRANQALLVRFFEAAKPFLAPPRPPSSRSDFEGSRTPSSDDQVEDEASAAEDDHLLPYPGDDGGGQIVVTLFEGEPYTLWNIRDLARHTGYRVIRSHRFPWEAYPGYSHARTLGNIRSKATRQDEGASHEYESGHWPDTKRRAWKGEERLARSFVFDIAELEPGASKQGDSHRNPNRKRARSTSTSDSDT